MPHTMAATWLDESVLAPFPMQAHERKGRLEEDISTDIERRREMQTRAREREERWGSRELSAIGNQVSIVGSGLIGSHFCNCQHDLRRNMTKITPPSIELPVPRRRLTSCISSPVIAPDDEADSPSCLRPGPVPIQHDY